MGDLALYRRLLRQARPYWFHLAALFGIGLLASPIALLNPVPLKIVVDSVLGSRPLPSYLRAVLPGAALHSAAVTLAVAIGLLLVVAALGQLQALANKVVRKYVGERLVLAFRSELVQRAQRLSLSYHDSIGTADSLYRIQQDATAIETIMVDGVVPFVAAAFTLVTMIAVTARLDRQLALVAMAVSPLLYFLSRAYRPRMRKQSRHVKKLESAALAVVQETLGALRVVKAFGQEAHETGRFVRRASEGVTARVRLALLEGRYGALVGLTSALGLAAVLLIGAGHVRTGALSLGQLLMVLSYLGQLYEPLRTISNKTAGFQSYLASAERAFALLDAPPEVAELPRARPLGRAAGAIAFQGVSFAYGPDRPVLRDVTFGIASGKSLGIVGTTGAGKTTLVSLLTRFYDPTAGQILLDGVNLRDYQLADLRRQFAVVLQDPVLFSVSIADNIAYASPGASREQIVAAAQAANAHEFIVRLPRGYDTQVGERGAQLSGGQRQRIALARAFLKDSPVLILDEPTSAVDAETEAEILAAIRRLMRGRTVIVISHRPSLLRCCEAHLVIENGRVASDGSAALPDAGPRVVPSGEGAGTTVHDVTRHPAAQAWCRLQPDAEPVAITPLRVRRWKSQVYRLEGAFPGGTAVIAKRCPRIVAALERTVYSELLAELPVPSLGFYGLLEEAESERCWLFIEEATGANYLNFLPEHRSHAGRWLGLLHSSAADAAATRLLPDGGPARYLDRLRGARDSMEENLRNPALSSDDVAFVEGVQARLDHLAEQWHRVEELCHRAPRTLVHGDFKGKNIRVRPVNGSTSVLVFDWEHAGWGVPAADLAQLRVLTGHFGASPDIAVYWSTVRDRWPEMSPDAWRRLAHCGTLFRMLSALYWEAPNLAYPWSHAYVAPMQKFVAELDGALEALGWTRPRAGAGRT